MSKKKKIIIIIVLAFIALVLFGINSVKAANARKRAENSQVDIELLQDFPLDADMKQACQWLEEKGLEYELKGGMVEEVATPNGWLLSICTNNAGPRGLYFALHVFDKNNYEIIYKRTQQQLTEAFGEPSYNSGGVMEWMLAENRRLYVNYHLDTGQVNVEIEPF